MKEVPPAKPSIYKLQQYYTSPENSNRFIQKLQTMSNVGYRCTETFDNAESSHHDTIYNIYTGLCSAVIIVDEISMSCVWMPFILR